MESYWPCLRLWCEEKVTWSDLEKMSLDLVTDLNDVLDGWNEAGKSPKK